MTQGLLDPGRVDDAERDDAERPVRPAARVLEHQLDDPVEMAAAADRLPIEQVASRWIVATTPDEVVDAVRPYVDAGFDHLVMQNAGPDPDGFLEFFTSELAAPLRALTPAGGGLLSRLTGG